jgi:tetratricopeptide (TPR) repeat protein
MRKENPRDQGSATHKYPGWCSFCRKNYKEIGPLCEGPDQIYICLGCAQRCARLIEEDYRHRGIPVPKTQVHPGEPLAYEKRAAAYAMSGQYHEAIHDWTETIRLNPESKHAYYNRGACHELNDEHDKAITDIAVTETVMREVGRFGEGEDCRAEALRVYAAAAYGCPAEAFRMLGDARGASEDEDMVQRLRKCHAVEPQRAQLGGIVISRTSQYANRLRRFELFVDGYRVADIKDGQRVMIPVEGGVHAVFAKIDWCRSPVASVSVLPGSDVHLVTGCHMRGWRVFFALLYLLTPGKYLYLERLS